MIATPVSRRKVFGTPALRQRKSATSSQVNPLTERARIANTPFLERSDTDAVTLELLDLADAYPRHRSPLLSAVRHLNPDVR